MRLCLYLLVRQTDNFHGLLQQQILLGQQLKATQLLTEMCTRGTSWEKRRPLPTADNSATFMYQLFRNSGSLNLLQSSRSVQTNITFVVSLSIPLPIN
jgi:hypothetical protein